MAKIFVIYDESNIRNLLDTLLRRKGYEKGGGDAAI
jgi:DNA-binding NtrC family response regulator